MKLKGISDVGFQRLAQTFDPSLMDEEPIVTQVGDAEVSTALLRRTPVIDHDGNTIKTVSTYETMVFGGPFNGASMASRSEELSIETHGIFVKAIENGVDPREMVG